MSNIYYWENFIEKKREYEYNKDYYVLTYSFIGQSEDYFIELIYLRNKKEVLEYLEYHILPSAILSKLVGGVNLEILDYEETIDILEDNIFRVDDRITKEYKELNKLLIRVKTSDDFEKDLDHFLEVYQEYFCPTNGYSIFFSNLSIYENMKVFGEELVSSYKEDGMIGYLEEELELKEVEIVNMFENLENNYFMQKKIKSFLLNKSESMFI